MNLYAAKKKKTFAEKVMSHTLSWEVSDVIVWQQVKRDLKHSFKSEKEMHSEIYIFI